MARARNIKPSFFMNETLAELSFEVRLLFIGLWTLADREGRLEDRPKRIGMELFPADGLDVEECLLALEKSGLIERYEAGGVKVVWVKNFKKHQSPHHTERGSALPDKNGVYAIANKGDAKSGAVNSRKDNGENLSDLLNPDLLIPDSSNDECLNKKIHGAGKEKERLMEKESEKSRRASSCPDHSPSPTTQRRGPITEKFVLSEEDKAFACNQGVDAVHELAAFKSYHKAKGSLMLDWHAAWQT